MDGDRNLPRDKFIQEQMRTNEGWLPIVELPTFNQIAKLTRDPEVIAKALKKSTSGLLEVSDDGKKVRRNPGLPIPKKNKTYNKKKVINRTIYAKGFPVDATLDELVNYFRNDDDIEYVFMRKIQSGPLAKTFKGSVYVTFKTTEKAVKFMESRPHKYQGQELLVLWQSRDMPEQN